MPISSSSAAATTTVPVLGGPEDQGFWEEYLKKMTDEDIRSITRWQKFLETLLVYVGLFIGVLTAFVIQVSNIFQPSPDATTSDVSLSFPRVSLLYFSLYISVAEAALVLVISVWLTRYQRSLPGTGPTIHDRIRQRHESYTGLMEWRLPILIEILPMVALVALGLFAYFISDVIVNIYPVIGYTLHNIIVFTALLFVSTSSMAAFIPGAPFHSPLSSFIRLTFRIFPNQSIRGVIRIRTICVILICGVSLACFISFPRLPTVISTLLAFLVSVSLPSLCQRTQAEKKAQEQPKPRLFSLATWLSSNIFVTYALFVARAYLQHRARVLSLVLFGLSCVMIVVTAIGAVQMSQWTPDENKAKAEAVAFMIKTQPSPDVVAFQNAVEIARDCAHLRSTLLKDILPVLDVLITSIQGVRVQDLEYEEKVYIILLAFLVDFEPSKASLWRNEAAVKQPVLSDELKEKLRILRRSGCSHSSSPLFGCTKAVEFILDKVGDCICDEFSAFDSPVRFPLLNTVFASQRS